MPSHRRSWLFSLFGAFDTSWARPWRCAAIQWAACLASVELLMDPTPPPAASLEALGQAMDVYLRSPAFLELLQRGLALTSRPVGLVYTRSVVRKRVSR